MPSVRERCVPKCLLGVFGDENALERMAAVHPLGRIGRPEEIADAVVWLFSDRSSYYTGQSLTLDGGLTAQRPFAQQQDTQLRATSAVEHTDRTHIDYDLGQAGFIATNWVSDAECQAQML